MYHLEFYERIKTPFPNTCTLVPEIFKFEKCVKYANEMTDDVIHSTQYDIVCIKLSHLGQFAAQIIDTWQANSSTGNTRTATKTFVAMAIHSFPVPTHLISMC